MSRAIENLNRDSKTVDIAKLKSAIDSAGDKGVLIFCSADDSSRSRDAKIPQVDLGPCFRIGGASATGDKLAWVEEDLVNYLLPGELIPFKVPGEKSYQYGTGSFLATACAAGLAAALLYSDRAINNPPKLSDRDSMANAFQALAQGNQFVDVQANLEERFMKMIMELGPERTVTWLEDNMPGTPIRIASLTWEDPIVQTAFRKLLDYLVEWEA